MDNFLDKKPSVRQAWLRVVLFLLFFLLVAFLISIPILLLVIPIKFSDLKTDLPNAIAELSSGSLWAIVLIEFFSSFIAVFVFRKFVDRKDLLSLGFRTDGRLNEMLAGFFLAPAIIGLGALILYFTKHLEWDANEFQPQTFLIDVGTLILIAISEEIVFRGYVLNNLMQSFNKWVALVISSILFTFFHLSNPGISALPMATLFLAGMLFGINYIYTKNLWFSILLHFSWNFFQGLVYGFKVSGIQFSSLLQTNLKGDISITGGDFGFEGSVLATALLFFVVVVFYFVNERRFAAEEL